MSARLRQLAKDSRSFRLVLPYLKLVILTYSLSIVWLLLTRYYFNSESEADLDFDQAYQLERLSSSE